MTEQEAFEAFCAKWDAEKTEAGLDVTEDEVNCAEEAWHAALAWLRSQGEPVAWMHNSPMPDGSIFAGASVERLIIGQGVTPDTTEVPLFLAPQPAIPDGWKLVPVEPTEEMLKAAIEAELCDTYCAMLNAAPEPRK